jgi:hypothetical protein
MLKSGTTFVTPTSTNVPMAGTDHSPGEAEGHQYNPLP